MTASPKLTICVPSRNRQRYFQKTIEGMIRNPRQDVQFVLTDNSDDPSIMNNYMDTLHDDPRIVYLPSTDRTLPMLENWERTLAAATGEWVTVIGDDDHCDPDVTDVIIGCQKTVPDLEGLSWGCLSYTWPVEGEDPGAVLVPLGNLLIKPTRRQLEDRMFGWELAGVVPTSGFSLYHSAIRRSLLDKIRERAGGKYFEHPVVDYDMAMKIITTGSSFVYCERPFSVMGVCPEANSFGIGRLSDTKAKISSFDNELGRSFDRDDYLRDFPFYNLLGVPCSIAIAQHWFKKHYNYSYSGWEKNFVEACARYVELFPNRDEFDFMKQAYLDTLEKWQGGRFTKHFKPKLPEQSSGPAGGGGFTETGVYVKSNIGGASNPYELFDIVSAFVRPTNLIDTKDILSAPKATDDRRQGRK